MESPMRFSLFLSAMAFLAGGTTGNLCDTCALMKPDGQLKAMHCHMYGAAIMCYESNSQCAEDARYLSLKADIKPICGDGSSNMGGGGGNSQEQMNKQLCSMQMTNCLNILGQRIESAPTDEEIKNNKSVRDDICPMATPVKICFESLLTTAVCKADQLKSVIDEAKRVENTCAGVTDSAVGVHLSLMLLLLPVLQTFF